jgi:hypothetical protein
MFTNVLSAVKTAARDLFRNWRALIAFFLLFAALVGGFYLFVWSREASLWQVIFSLTFPFVWIVMFFVFQTMGVNYTQSGGSVVRRSLRDFWKLLLVSLPLILLAWLFIYLIGKIPVEASPAAAETARAAVGPLRAPAAATAQPARWLAILRSALLFLVFGIVMPLVTIHLWIAAARAGLKRAWRVALCAFAPRAVVTYALGLLVFGALPYLLIFTRTPAKNAWLDMGLLGTRLALAFLLIMFGWVVTLGALSVLSQEKNEAAGIEGPKEAPAANLAEKEGPDSAASPEKA